MTWATGLLAPDQPWAPLLVAAPLAAALAAVPLGRRAPLLLVALAPFAGALAALAIAQVWSHGEIVYHVGGWPPPLGITLRIDGLSVVFIATTAVVATGVALFALPKYGRQSKAETRAAFAFWPLLFAMWAGLNAVFVSNDLFNLYVALELLTLTAVALVALDGKPETMAAAIRYLLFALTGSLAYLLGVVFLYGIFGNLDISALATSARPHAVVLAAGVLMTTGLLAKTALFPAGSGVGELAVRTPARSVQQARPRVHGHDQPVFRGRGRLGPTLWGFFPLGKRLVDLGAEDLSTDGIDFCAYLSSFKRDPTMTTPFPGPRFADHEASSANDGLSSCVHRQISDRPT